MRHVVLLRGVNVGGHNRLAMTDLRAVLEDVGCSGVRTFLQSGNAVVSHEGVSPAAVQERLRRDLGLDVHVFVRTADDLDAVVAANPFADQQLDPTLLHAVFLDGPTPSLPDLAPDRVVPGHAVLYVAYASNAHSSKAAKLLSSKRFPVPATARNWRTVLALRDLAAG